MWKEELEMKRLKGQAISRIQVFRNQLIVAGIFVALAAIGTLMNATRAAAQGPPDGLAVRVAGPLPLPVSGSVGVSGTIAATQSGPWAVGATQSGPWNVGATQSGSWNVNATIQGMPLVNLNYSASNPVPTLDLARRAGSIVELDCIFTEPGNISPPCILTTPDAVNGGPFTVPAGEFLVVTSVDAFGDTTVPGITFFDLEQDTFVRSFFRISNTAAYTQFEYPSGIVFPPGYQLRILVSPHTGPGSAPGNTQAGVGVTMRGYLTPQ